MDNTAPNKAKQYATIRRWIKFCNDNGIGSHEVYANVIEGKLDFDAGDWRFIHDSAIDETVRDELSADEHMLGCFAPWALAHATGLPIKVFTALADAGNCEVSGEIVLAIDGAAEKLANTYISNDGYGRHFAHYDHEDHELPGDWHAFRTN